jgi:hypothetical protein
MSDSDMEDFEDWSHPSGRILSIGRRRRGHWNLLTLTVWLMILGTCAGVFWAAWHVGFMIRDAYRVVFG